MKTAVTRVSESIFCLLFLLTAVFAQRASDSVIVTVTTSTYNGQYAPKNASMMWIQKPDKTFIKTICKKAASYIRFCTLWNSVSKGDYDALTGASRTSHGVLTGKWDCTGQDGKPVPAGTYEFWVEMTENNATGKNAHGTIVIDGVSKTVQGTTATNFQNFSAVYKALATGTGQSTPEPLINAVTVELKNGVAMIRFPNTGVYTLSIIAPTGKKLQTSTVSGVNCELDLHTLAHGIYMLQVADAAGNVTITSKCIYR